MRAYWHGNYWPVIAEASTTPAGPVALAQDALKDMLADCQAFQDLVDAVDSAEAAESIHLRGLPGPDNGKRHTKDELQGYRPYAIIFTHRDDGLQAMADATSADGFDFSVNGRLGIRLERDAGETNGDDPDSQDNEEWENIIGKIWDELMDLAGRGGYLAATDINLVDFNWNPKAEHESMGIYQGAIFTVGWEGGG